LGAVCILHLLVLRAADAHQRHSRLPGELVVTAAATPTHAKCNSSSNSSYSCTYNNNRSYSWTNSSSR
jgi:hypothetical protein